MGQDSVNICKDKLAKPGVDIHWIKHEGVVTINWAPAFRVEPAADKSFQLWGVSAILQRFSVDKPAVQQALEAAASNGAAGNPSEWCL